MKNLINLKLTHADIIQSDICSFGNPAITKEHWFQIYPLLSQFGHLVVKLKTWLPPTPYSEIHFIDLHGFTDPQISTTKHHFGAILYKTSLFMLQISRV
jgi:hypothetical protein